MIPAFSISGVLPPHAGDPRDPSQVSPYRVSTSDLVQRYGVTTQRIAILEGLLNYRERMRSIGFTSGFQVLDGSFTENIESTELRAPKDIDVVTFAARPQAIADTADWITFIQTNQSLFNSNETKRQFLCDAYFVDLSIDPLLLMDHVFYWNALFSHRRDGLWKGMLRVELGESDVEARTRLTGLAQS